MNFYNPFFEFRNFLEWTELRETLPFTGWSFNGECEKGSGRAVRWSSITSKVPTAESLVPRGLEGSKLSPTPEFGFVFQTGSSTDPILERFLETSSYCMIAYSPSVEFFAFGIMVNGDGSSKFLDMTWLFWRSNPIWDSLIETNDAVITSEVPKDLGALCKTLLWLRKV